MITLTMNVKDQKDYKWALKISGGMNMWTDDLDDAKEKVRRMNRRILKITQQH